MEPRLWRVLNVSTGPQALPSRHMRTAGGPTRTDGLVGPGPVEG